MGPLLFFLDFMDSIVIHSGVSFQLWYLDDGTFAGTRSAVVELLELFWKHGPSFGLTLNLKKCDVFSQWGLYFWGDFPPEASLPLQVSDRVELLGAPIFDLTDGPVFYLTG